ncbi:hypothetical protein MUP79_10085 [Candidatus Bathyarchaeota archaeon]|nr:hypothetical protein [Candidatus Bathyarchaeota archaeon]
MGDDSIGTNFTTGEARTVDVTTEDLDVHTGFEGDPVTYTATVLDSTAAKLPATFVASLKIDGTEVVTDQVFDAGHYSQSTGLLTLAWVVPAPTGALTVKLTWEDQVI